MFDVGMQRPNGSHTWPSGHDWQLTPPVPHAAAVGVVTHWLPTQHPLQLAGLQAVCAWQLPPFAPEAAQLCPAPHAVQS